MDQIDKLLSEVDEYAAAHGIQPATVCRLATGNPRLRDRMIRRAEQLSADVERLRSYMVSNPPSVESAPSQEAS
jgi:DNA-binding MurR/RpiR family transcriptional regulator